MIDADFWDDILEELEEGETDVLEMYKEKSNKLDKILNELSSSIMEEHKWKY